MPEPTMHEPEPEPEPEAEAGARLASSGRSADAIEADRRREERGQQQELAMLAAASEAAQLEREVSSRMVIHDFAGEMRMYDLHQLFVGGGRTLYLVVFSLADGMHEAARGECARARCCASI